MPIYEYRCPNGHVFEVFQRMDDPPPEKCTTCGASPLQRVLFPVAVHFKGSGFYSTDYGRKSKSAASDSGKSESSSDSKSSDKTSDSSSSGGSSEPKKAAEA
jgi:putative FmdB family regulatory protein